MIKELLALAIVMAILIPLVAWHNSRFDYRCRHCGHIFSISYLTNLFSIHWPTGSGGAKLLRCPQCRRISGAAVVAKNR